MVASLSGQAYNAGVARRVPARSHLCVLCEYESSAWCWDHCHEHGLVRGPLCRTCNRLMSDVDAGLRVGAVSGRRPRQGQLSRRQRLVEYRSRCPRCKPWLPPIAQWVKDARARRVLEVSLKLGAWSYGCARCPVVQAIHRVPINPQYYRNVASEWKKRVSGEWALFPPQPRKWPIPQGPLYPLSRRGRDMIRRRSPEAEPIPLPDLGGLLAFERGRSSARVGRA